MMLMRIGIILTARIVLTVRTLLTLLTPPAGLGGAHWLGRSSTPGLSSAPGNLGHGFLTSTVDWEQRGALGHRPGSWGWEGLGRPMMP